MVNFQLDEMQEGLKELAHDFAVDEIRPKAEHWDAESESWSCIDLPELKGATWMTSLSCSPISSGVELTSISD